MRSGIGLLVWMTVAVGARFACGLEITGQVVDSKARPVEGAEVAVYEQYWVNWNEDYGRLAGPIVKTDQQGRFQLQTNVSRQRDAYIVARRDGLSMAWDGLNGSHHYMLGKGHFSFVLEPRSALAGQLVDPNGKPVGQARVQALPFNSRRGAPILAPPEWFTTTTDSQGRFRFSQFAADVSARFRINVPGSVNTNVFTTEQKAGCGFEVWRSDIRLVLPREGTVRGQVVNDSARPIGGVDLLIGPHLGSREFMSLYLFRRTRSNPDGSFVFANIPEGLHLINVVSPEVGLESWVGEPVNVLLKPGQATANTTIRVVQGGVLEVTALEAQTRRPLPGMKVFAFGQQWRRDAPVLTDAKGAARLRVPVGNFTLAVQSANTVDWRGTEQVADGQTLPYLVLMTVKPEFTGRVLDPANHAVTDAAVTIHPFGDHVYTDDEGRFTGHADPEYGARGGIVVARDTRTGLALAMPIVDWSKSADLRLAPAWTLTGRIVDPNGVGVAAAHVALDISLDSQRGLSDLGVKALTDVHGRFEMKAIPPVQRSFRYTLSACAARFSPRENLSLSVSGPAGAAADIGTIELLPADQSLLGVVVDANGAPAAGVPVTAMSMEGGGFPPPEKSTTTDEKGEFRIRGLCKGPTRVQAGTGLVQTVLPTQDVKIILGREIRTAGEYPLLGKPLPSLADLSATLSSAQVDGKPVLVCLMDIEQRPSRQCLSELAKKAGALATQGVGLLVVQTSKVDVKQYDMWLKQNGVTIPIHVASADFETKRREWGVKAVPWLILTDKSHVVCAEGFAVGDLDKVLQEVK